MKKTMTLLVLLLIGMGTVRAEEKKFSLYGVGFYNLENLFDTCHDEGHNDFDFLPDGQYKWTGLKYSHKLRNMARVLSEMGTDKLRTGCAIIGVSEVENAKCLQDLCDQEPLKARNFQFAHIEGPDRRGVDCALLYNPRFFTVENVELFPYVQALPEDSAYKTRGFLTVTGTLAQEKVIVIVCHLPSRFSGSFYREQGGRQVRVLKDSLVNANPDAKVFIMGDMNDDPQDKSMAEALGAKRKAQDVEVGGLWNPFWDTLANGIGTLKYNDNWNLFDQIILSQSLLDQSGQKDYSTLKYWGHQVFTRDYLIQKEGKYKGQSRRTHVGGVWLDGYSDHFPTVVYIIKEVK